MLAVIVIGLLSQRYNKSLFDVFNDRLIIGQV
nr:MAG TPA: hypothetical protein [Caudoviricetes sp.]